MLLHCVFELLLLLLFAILVCACERGISFFFFWLMRWFLRVRCVVFFVYVFRSNSNIPLTIQINEQTFYRSFFSLQIVILQWSYKLLCQLLRGNNTWWNTWTTEWENCVLYSTDWSFTLCMYSYWSLIQCERFSAVYCFRVYGVQCVRSCCYYYCWLFESLLLLLL